MPNYFIDKANILPGESVMLSEEDAKHLSFVLRMKQGDSVTLHDAEGYRLACEITAFTAGSVTVTVIHRTFSETEASFISSAYIALAKGDKIDSIVKNLVELGISRICPFVSHNCVVKLDSKSAEKKRERWQKIALSAAKQSGRARVPAVSLPVSFTDAVQQAVQSDVALLFYEKYGCSMADCISGAQIKTLSFITGAEGGFTEPEIALAKEKGIRIATLGRRILRCETAPVVAFSVLSYLLGEYTTIKEHLA